MFATPRDAYLETQVATATPQKLRLLLVEGAIRWARRTLELWQENQAEPALEALIRCREIIAELLSGVRPDGSALCKQVTGIYAFLFQRLTEAQLHHQPGILEEVIEVLEEERLTWQQLCQQMPAAPDAGLRRQFAPQEITAGITALAGGTLYEGLSLDA